jgi:formylmethanofuran dehydrogenase subunit E
MSAMRWLSTCPAPTNGCFADGLSVATGCWLGRRTLRLVDCGRVGVTAVDTTGADELLRVEPVALSASLENLLGKPGVRVACVVCGEDVLNGRELATPAGPVCRARAMEPYYRPLEADVSGTPPEATSVSASLDATGRQS